MASDAHIYARGILAAALDLTEALRLNTGLGLTISVTEITLAAFGRQGVRANLSPENFEVVYALASGLVALSPGPVQARLREVLA